MENTKYQRKCEIARREYHRLQMATNMENKQKKKKMFIKTEKKEKY